jgi:hypothetical protein
MIKTLTMHNNDTTSRHIGVKPHIESHPNVPWHYAIVVHKECKDRSKKINVEAVLSEFWVECLVDDVGWDDDDHRD